VSARVAVLASGGGTNLQALLDHAASGGAGYRVVVVVSDRPGAGALERARRARVPAHVVPVAGGPDAESEAALLAVLEGHGADLVALAGYLRLVPGAVVDRYRGRIVNVHPAPLPRFGGKGMYGERVQRAVLDAGVEESGPTVHLVDEEYDRGEVLAHERVPVLPDDTPESLAARVLAAEHALYPRVLDRLAARLGAAAGVAHEPSDR
jgi:phosphoribosylglycinamide formyltransferase-1